MSEVDFKDHFSQGATGYAIYRPSYPRELVQWLAELAPADRCVWDCGCGNGQLSRPLAEYFQQVIATDASAAQIAEAQPHPRIAYSVAPAEQTTIEEQSVDLVVVAQAAHWFDLPRFYREVKRVARPEAAIALVSYGLLEFESAPVNQALHALYSEDLGSYWPAERRYIDNQYRDLLFPFRDLPTPVFTIETAWTLAELRGYLQTWSATQKAAAAGFFPLATLMPELEALWQKPDEKKRVRWPIILRAAKLAG
ncbi:class I SAM-dependent methyltransferase [Exilibacterium tricleocarpae]|uniref:Class I SAM-dependent methyltransferase n=1 Tax=Exilibacterium tricleocarpae TaxID=2591008 RepID=A0A545U3G3_9GAMM|nr:class I SAM-dependent methyltransferase [Exilibacterium tricleocarpae]TQV84019.1 class I SAM-dependent methyltransferase [Exilibacterium tricleocarpae]